VSVVIGAMVLSFLLGLTLAYLLMDRVLRSSSACIRGVATAGATVVLSAIIFALTIVIVWPPHPWSM